MEYSEKVFEKKFLDENPKQAYLKACKWLAKNFYNKDELVEYFSVKIKREKEKNQFTSFIVTLYANVNGTEIDERFCKKCKSMYAIFYSIDKPKCEECKKNIYTSEMSKQLRSIKNLLQELCDSDENGKD